MRRDANVEDDDAVKDDVSSSTMHSFDGDSLGNNRESRRSTFFSPQLYFDDDDDDDYDDDDDEDFEEFQSAGIAVANPINDNLHASAFHKNNEENDDDDTFCDEEIDQDEENEVADFAEFQTAAENDDFVRSSSIDDQSSNADSPFRESNDSVLHAMNPTSFADNSAKMETAFSSTHFGAASSNSSPLVPLISVVAACPTWQRALSNFGCILPIDWSSSAFCASLNAVISPPLVNASSSSSSSSAAVAVACANDEGRRGTFGVRSATYAAERLARFHDGDSKECEGDEEEDLRRAFDYHNIVTPCMPVTGKALLII